MIVSLDILLFLILIATAVLALKVRDLLTAVALLAAYSLFAALLFAGMQAVDVAFVEAALGAGLTGVLMIVAILATSRRIGGPTGTRRRLAVLPVIGLFVGLMLFASVGLPDRGDPDAPAHQRVAPEYLGGSMEDTQTPNVVTAVLADYRSMDTLSETLVILTAALAASLVLFRREPGEDATPGAPDATGTPADAIEDPGHDIEDPGHDATERGGQS